MESKHYQEKTADVDRTDEQYQEVIDRVDNTKIRLLHHSIGISGESGELLDAIKKHVFYDKPLDIENVLEEISDLIWYEVRLLAVLGYSLEDAMAYNHDKLNKKRYAGGYSDAKAQARADKVEEAQ